MNLIQINYLNLIYRLNFFCVTNCREVDAISTLKKFSFVLQLLLSFTKKDIIIIVTTLELFV